MTTECPMVADFSMHNQSSAARILEIDRVTLYRWVVQNIAKPMRTKGSKKVCFTGKELKRIWNYYWFQR